MWVWIPSQVKTKVFVEHTNILCTQSRNLHFAVSWRKQDGFCSLLSSPCLKKNKAKNVSVELLSSAFLLITWAVSTKCVHEDWTKLISYIKWGSEQPMWKKTHFTPRPVTDAAQLLSLPLKYFKEGWQISLLCEPYNKISPTWEPQDTSHSL